MLRLQGRSHTLIKCNLRRSVSMWMPWAILQNKKNKKNKKKRIEKVEKHITILHISKSGFFGHSKES